MIPRIPPALLTVLALTALTAGEAQPPAAAMRERIAADRWLAHEGRPHGTVADWAFRPRGGGGIDAGVAAVNQWGQIYRAVDGDPVAADRLRVQIRELRLHARTEDGAWHLLHAAAAEEGAAYREDFAGDDAIQADRVLDPSSGLWSVRLSRGRSYHFWARDGWRPLAGYVVSGRSTVTALASSFQARLVDAQTLGPPDPAAVGAARLVAGAGGDRSLADGSFGWDWCEGRFSLLGADWMPVTACTASAAEILAAPPPLYPETDAVWLAGGPLPGWSTVAVGAPAGTRVVWSQDFEAAGPGAAVPGWTISGGVSQGGGTVTATGVTVGGSAAAALETMGSAAPAGMALTAATGIAWRPDAWWLLRCRLWKQGTQAPYQGRVGCALWAGDPDAGGLRFAEDVLVGGTDGYDAWRAISWPVSVMSQPAAPSGSPIIHARFTAGPPVNTAGPGQVQIDDVELIEVDPPPRGSAVCDGVRWTLAAHGGGLGGAADRLQLTARHRNGDFAVQARVESLVGGLAGVMVREGDAAGAAFVAVVQDASGAVSMRWRDATGVAAGQGAAVAGASGRWLRIVRSGASLTGSWSADGIAWNALGTRTPAVAGGPLLAGYALVPAGGTADASAVVSAGAAGAPSFTVQPAAATVGAGASCTLTATVTGVPAPSLQWHRDGVAVAGATAASWTIAAAAAGDAGTWTCVAANAAGTAVSGPAVVQVVPVGAGTITCAASEVRVREGDPGSALVELTVLRSGGAAGAVTCSWAFTPGTALAGEDMAPAAGTLSWPAGDTGPRTIAVSLLGDDLREGDETATLTLSGAMGGAALGLATTTVVIMDDDELRDGVQLLANPGFEADPAGSQGITCWSSWSSGSTAGDAVAAGGIAGANRLEHARPGTATWDMYTWQTLTGLEDGRYRLRAQARRQGAGFAAARLEAKDYGGALLSVAIPDGPAWQPVAIDAIVVAGGSCTVGLWTDVPAAAGSPSVHLDEVVFEREPAGVLTVAVPALQVTEGAVAACTVRRGGGARGAVSVAWSVLPGSAGLPADAAAASGTLAWADGDASDRIVQVATVADAVVDGGETFRIRLSSPAGGAVLGAPAEATATIIEPNTAPVIVQPASASSGSLVLP